MSNLWRSIKQAASQHTDDPYAYHQGTEQYHQCTDEVCTHMVRDVAKHKRVVDADVIDVAVQTGVVVQGRGKEEAGGSAREAAGDPPQARFRGRADGDPVASTFNRDSEHVEAGDPQAPKISGASNTYIDRRPLDGGPGSWSVDSDPPRTKKPPQHKGPKFIPHRPKVFPRDFDLVDDGSPEFAALYAKFRAGRPRFFACNADRQRAYRNRLKARVAAQPPLYFA